jgi:hypothetical protein
MWDEIAVYGQQPHSIMSQVWKLSLYDGHVEFLRWPSKFPADITGMLLTNLF